MNKQLPLVALVGEPNVGKSTLLNKIAGGRAAVTSPVAGTTRDRQYIDTSWNGVDFTLVDTAGLSFETDELGQALKNQIEVAVEEADLLLLVVDGKADPRSIEQKTLLKFRKSSKPLALVVNKLDSTKKREEMVGSFQKLGIKPLFGISSVTGMGIGDLLDHVTGFIKENKLDNPAAVKTSGIAVSIVGKPNVGKSTLLNKILKEERVVVSSIPGTTRTAIDTTLAIDGVDYTFIDTAGLKKKEYRQALPDVFSGFQTFKAIRRSDVSFFVVDATEPLSKQDQQIAREIFEMSKGVVIVASKFDLFDGDEKQLRDYISLHFPFLWFAPLFLVSGVTGEGLDKALASLKPIYDNRQKEVPPEAINKVLAKTLKLNPPKILRDQREPKVFGLSQVATNPPVFELFVNHSAAISQQYRRYIQKAIIKYLDFWGTPVSLKIRGKDKK